jgi:cyclophilin family peptidyl-prolyl cis-trans isomerase
MLNKSFLALISSFLIAITASAQTAPKRTTRSTTRTRSTAVRRSLYRPATLNQKAPAVFRAKFTTTQGDFVIEVTRAWSPLGADRFYNLVKNGFYSDASLFRVLPRFVVQFGISSKPAIAKVWDHATIKDDPVVESNVRDHVTFATGGPNTRTTQVFINLGDNARLDSMGFSPFGKVVEGMEVVEKFYSGYGEGAPQGNGPDQGRLTNEGKAYLDKGFPKLDSIKTAVILGSTPAASSKEKP